MLLMDAPDVALAEAELLTTADMARIAVSEVERVSFRKAIGQAPKASSVSKKSSRAGKTLTGTAGKTSADPHAVIALKAVLAGKSVKVTETALRG